MPFALSLVMKWPRQPVEIKPDLADAHNTLGALLCAKGSFDADILRVTRNPAPGAPGEPGSGARD